MDNFMDKIAQKFSTQDIMKANASAEATELKKLQMQVSEYESLLANMRQVNLKNVTMTESMQTLLGQMQSMMSTVEMKQQGDADGFAKQREQLDELNRAIEDLATKLEKEAEEVEEDDLGKEQEVDKEEELKEYIHTESVKVYRNVQAVVAQGFKEMERTNQASENKLRIKLKSTKGCAVACVILLAINLLITCAHFAMDLLTQVFGITIF